MSVSKPSEFPEFARTKQLCFVLEISRSTLYEWVKKKAFPAPIKLGNRNAWLWADVLKFIEIKRNEAVAA